MVATYIVINSVSLHNRTVELMKVGMVPIYSPSAIVHSIHREVTTASFSPGDTAWMLSATALVLSMTIPGLALYYSGLVRVKVSIHYFYGCQFPGEKTTSLRTSWRA